MNLDGDGRDTRRRAADAELDALVVQEVEALAARRPRPARRERFAEAPTARREDTLEDEGGERREATFDVEAEPAASRQESNVIGLRRAGSPARDVPFSAEEEAFIEESVAFLRRRDNADLIIEELWSHAVLDRDDSMDDLGDSDVDPAKDLDVEHADIARKETSSREDQELGAEDRSPVTPIRSRRPSADGPAVRPGRSAREEPPERDEPPSGESDNEEKDP